MRHLRSTLAACAAALVPLIVVACGGGSEVVSKSGTDNKGGTRGFGANGQGFGANGQGANGRGANGSGFGANGQGGDQGFGANGSGFGANGQGGDQGFGANGSGFGANGQGANGSGFGANGQGANGQAGNGQGAGPTNTPCTGPASCEDNNECTVDTCPQGFCVYVAKLEGTACKDSGACKFGACASPGCGDGVLGLGEECDDGNKLNDDNCNNACQLSSCGNKIIDGQEKCDDGNPDDFDGCTSFCQRAGTSDGLDFDALGEGSYGVIFDDKKNLVLDPGQSLAQKVKPLIWVANSGEGTVSKIDTETMVELGRYCTAPGCKGDPSRSTVALSGDAVVANRGGGSAVFIAAGTDKVSCNDRNNNGKVDTSTGSTPMMWPEGQDLSPDECAGWWTDFRGQFGSSPLPRAAGFDAEIGTFGELSTYVYIGLFSAQKLLRMDAKTGNIVKVIDVPGRPYGLVLDRNGAVWIQGGSLIKVDTKNDDKITVYDGRCMYGIAADGLGRIYTSGGGCVGRFDPEAEKWDVISSGTSAGGIAIDQNNHVWTGSSPLVEINADGKGPMSKVGTADVGGWGVAIDKNNKPWVIPFRGNQAHRVNPEGAKPYGHQSMAIGEGAYTYSDMTGYQLINAASRAGIYRKTFQQCSSAKWDKVEIRVLTPDATKVVISARTALSSGALKDAQFKRVATIPPDGKIFELPKDLAVGPFIQLEVSMSTEDLGKTPIMSYLAAYSTGCGKNLATAVLEVRACIEEPVPDYFGSLARVEITRAVFLLLVPTLLALGLWFCPVDVRLRRRLATASGAATGAFAVGFAVSLGNLPASGRALVGHAFGLVRIGSFDAGLTLCVDALSVTFAGVVALASWAAQSRVGDEGDDERPLLLAWALGGLLAVLADDVALAAAGIGLVALALTALAARADSHTPRGMLAGVPVVVLGVGAFFWLPAGTLTADGLVPDGRARAGSVETTKRSTAPRPALAGEGTLTMTGAPGAWLVLDGDTRGFGVTPFARARVSSGLHAGRVLGGSASDDVEVSTFFVPPGGEAFLAVIGPSTSFREVQNQLRLEATAGRLALRDRLRDERVGGLPIGVVVGGLLSLGALLASGLLTTSSAPPTPPRGGAAGGADAALLVSRLALAPYLAARVEPLASAAPFGSAVFAGVLVAGAGASALRAGRTDDASRALSFAADAMALLATACVFGGSPAAAAVIAVAAGAGLLLAAGSGYDPKLQPTYASGTALIVLPPLGMAAPWALGHTAAALAQAVSPMVAAVFAAGAALTFGWLAYGLLRLVLDPEVDPPLAAAPIEQRQSAREKKRGNNKASKRGAPASTTRASEHATAPRTPIATDRSARPLLSRILLGAGLLVTLLGALPIGSLLGLSLPLFGWIEAGARARPGDAAPALGVTVLVAVSALLGFTQAKKPRSRSAREGSVDEAAPDLLAPLAVALRGLRLAFSPTTSLQLGTARAGGGREAPAVDFSPAGMNPPSDAVDGSADEQGDDEAPR